MAHLQVKLVLLSVSFASGLIVGVAPCAAAPLPEAASYSASFDDTVLGNTVYETLSLTKSVGPLHSRHSIPTRRAAVSCYFSQWHLRRVNQVSLERHYGVFMYNSCDHDKQIFPTPADPSSAPVTTTTPCSRPRNTRSAQFSPRITSRPA